MAPAVPAAKQSPTGTGAATPSPVPTAAQRAALAAAAAVARSTRANPPPSAAPANTTQAMLPGKPSGRMALGKVIKGRLAKPMRLLVYGIEGVGKSTFAAGAPAPIFFGSEDGTSELDIERFPQPQSWLDALEALAELTTAAHDYQTLVIDTLDWLEPHCWAHVCRESRDDNGRPYQSIEDFGYGRGYVAAHDQWRRLASDLETLRTKRHMHIILLAHSAIRTFRNPAGDDFDRYELKLHKAPSGFWREWADAVLFASHDLNTVKKAGRVRGVMGNQRVLHTERTAAWDAKNRYDLPPRLALDWQEFADAAAAHRPADRRTLLAQIEAQLEALAEDDVRVARARAAVARAVEASDDAEIARIANKLAAIVAAADESPTDANEAPQ
jgi:hypothetical protein